MSSKFQPWSCYSWPELLYDDVFRAWEVIAAARQVASPQFFLFIAMALVQYYRDIILDNNMDFTDIIKFFNGSYYSHYFQWNSSCLMVDICSTEMAEHHNANVILKLARDLVLQLQTLIEDNWACEVWLIDTTDVMGRISLLRCFHELIINRRCQVVNGCRLLFTQREKESLYKVRSWISLFCCTAEGVYATSLLQIILLLARVFKLKSTWCAGWFFLEVTDHVKLRLFGVRCLWKNRIMTVGAVRV